MNDQDQSHHYEFRTSDNSRRLPRALRARQFATVSEALAAAYRAGVVWDNNLTKALRTFYCHPNHIGNPPRLVRVEEREERTSPVTRYRVAYTFQGYGWGFLGDDPAFNRFHDALRHGEIAVFESAQLAAVAWGDAIQRRLELGLSIGGYSMTVEPFEVPGETITVRSETPIS